MKDVLCIYPKDSTTEFLRPVYNRLCENGANGYDEDILGDDDDWYEKLETCINNCSSIIFLGHGSSDKLYGNGLNPLITQTEVDWLRGKRMVLFACRTTDFIKRYKLNQAMGFGNIITSLDEARLGGFHKLDTSELQSNEMSVIQKSLVEIWLHTLDRCDVFETRKFYKLFKFYTNVEICTILLHLRDKYPHYRKLADILYYLKEDINYFE